MKSHVLSVLGAALLCAACSNPIAPDAGERVVGIIEWNTTAAAPGAMAEPETVVSAPDTVDAGMPFTVTITTIGASGCWREDGALESVSGLTATLTPHDRVIEEIDGMPVSCTGALVSLPRDMSLTFRQTGSATLRVIGRRVTNGDIPAAQTKTIEQQIVVR